MDPVFHQATMLDESYEFFKRHAPDLNENMRAAVLLKGIELDLPDMLIEIQCTAVIPKCPSGDFMSRTNRLADDPP